jgi:hypothetical protein
VPVKVALVNVSLLFVASLVQEGMVVVEVQAVVAVIYINAGANSIVIEKVEG